MISSMERRAWDNARLAFWLAPLVSTLLLIPFFSFPSSPLFLGTLMGDPAHPFLWPRLGPWLSAAAVVFDGTLLGYFTAVLMAVPVYLVCKGRGKLAVARVLIVYAVAGVLASQLVHVLQGFRQPALREFAVSWVSPIFGCLCGLVSGTFFVVFAKRRFTVVARQLAYAFPVAILVACATTLVWSAKVWKNG